MNFKKIKDQIKTKYTNIYSEHEQFISFTVNDMNFSVHSNGDYFIIYSATEDWEFMTSKRGKTIRVIEYFVDLRIKD